MPMGLKGAPATFQRIMNDFKKHLRARVFIYIDDLIVTSETPKEHLQDIDEVLSQIEAIGFILSKDGIQPSPEKVKAIRRYPTPTNVSEVRAFLGMCSFFRRFIYNFAFIAAPLYNLLKKNAKFEWTKECADAMSELQDHLVSPPILAAPRLGEPFVIETSGSSKAVAAVLRQDQNGEMRCIAYASRALNQHESRYPPIELEALALVFAVQKFRPYIDGAKCTVITDHAPLKALLHRKDLMGRLAKYQIILQEYDIQIVYRPGKHNLLCDALSRNPPIYGISTGEEEEEYHFSSTEARKEQDECPWISLYKTALQEGSDEPELSEYIIINDMLYKIPTKITELPHVVQIQERRQLDFFLLLLKLTGTTNRYGYHHIKRLFWITISNRNGRCNRVVILLSTVVESRYFVADAHGLIRHGETTPSLEATIWTKAPID
ncbi:unnamed protein product [Cylicocyclus nassatus]|uniref:RNA-directed DNA polymerase n=1 Tax=Cylicocyclus nassatus TaxID=53992 RepID=A0AA36DMI4_CYLNA|nr:unnamed protein product [Cylicocyclus nassatus]